MLTPEEEQIVQKLKDDFATEQRNSRSLANEYVKAIAEGTMWKQNFYQLKESSQAAVYQLDQMLGKFASDVTELIKARFQNCKEYDEAELYEELSSIMPPRLPPRSQSA